MDTPSHVTDNDTSDCATKRWCSPPLLGSCAFSLFLSSLMPFSSVFWGLLWLCGAFTVLFFPLAGFWSLWSPLGFRLFLFVSSLISFPCLFDSSFSSFSLRPVFLAFLLFILPCPVLANSNLGAVLAVALLVMYCHLSATLVLATLVLALRSRKSTGTNNRPSWSSSSHSGSLVAPPCPPPSSARPTYRAVVVS